MKKLTVIAMFVSALALSAPDSEAKKPRKGGVVIDTPGSKIRIGANGVSVESKEDDETIARTTKAAATVCKAGDSCKFTCPQGDCQFRCAKRSSCRATCSGGNCNQTCGVAAKCGFTCSGGNCRQSFRKRSKGRASCTGGDCGRLLTKTARVKLSCAGGDCVQLRRDKQGRMAID